MQCFPIICLLLAHLFWNVPKRTPRTKTFWSIFWAPDFSKEIRYQCWPSLTYFHMPEAQKSLVSDSPTLASLNWLYANTFFNSFFRLLTILLSFESPDATKQIALGNRINNKQKLTVWKILPSFSLARQSVCLRRSNDDTLYQKNSKKSLLQSVLKTYMHFQ